MKAIKTKILATSLAALTCASFTNVNKEEELCQLPNKYAAVSDKCFDQLLTNLKDVKAIIFVPDTKLTESSSWGLQAVEKKKDSVNLENYIRVTPISNTTDECSPKNKVSFEYLNMVVFVDKSYTDKLAKMNLVKVEGKLIGAKWKIQNPKIKIGDKLNVLIDDTTAGFTQVEFKV